MRSSDGLYGLVVLLFVAVFIVLFTLALIRGVFVGENAAIRALETQGYSEVRIVDKDIWFVGMRGCGDEDAAKFDAVAINPAGNEVDVFVCVGWPFKGATVRTN